MFLRLRTRTPAGVERLAAVMIRVRTRGLDEVEAHREGRRHEHRQGQGEPQAGCERVEERKDLGLADCLVDEAALVVIV